MNHGRAIYLAEILSGPSNTPPLVTYVQVEWNLTVYGQDQEPSGVFYAVINSSYLCCAI